MSSDKNNWFLIILAFFDNLWYYLFCYKWISLLQLVTYQHLSLLDFPYFMCVFHEHNELSKLLINMSLLFTNPSTRVYRDNYCPPLNANFFCHFVFEQVSPSQTVSTEEVRAVDLSLRRCYFSGERHITGLPVVKYQQDSCFMECRMYFLAQVCNCTPYFFPRTKGMQRVAIFFKQFY